MTDFDKAALETLVTEKTRAAGSSFYWAMRLLEPERRLAMYAIYAFCREIDDIVDEAGADEEKRRKLDLWVQDIEALYRQTLSDPADRIDRPAGSREERAAPVQALAAALRPAIRHYDLPMADFLAVIEGCRMDLGAGVVRPSLRKLDLYCDRVAAAVGRLSVRVFGDFIEESLILANNQGRALQLTNILRDVAVDARIGRLYLPDEILTRHGISGQDIPAILAHPALPLVCRDVAVIAESHFDLARAALMRCSRRAVRPAVVMLEIYWAIFRQCRTLGWQPQSEPISLPKTTKLWCAVRHGILAGF